MRAARRARAVIIHGGLLIGFAIPYCASPRLALSAHLTTLQSGLFLVAIALLWPRMGIGSASAKPIAHAVWLSCYALCIGQFVAALWGGSAVLPIAAAGRRAEPYVESIADGLIVGGSLVLTAACVAMLVSWGRSRIAAHSANH